MALFVGLAGAQVGNGVAGSNNNPFTCGLQNISVTPQLRAEGFTEQTGDIVLICTGGSPIPVGTQIPTVNITVFYNVQAVTSRLINNTSGVNASEALLMIDEPNAGLAGSQQGYGPALRQHLCSSVIYGAGPGGCVEYVGTTGGNGVQYTGVPVEGSATSSTPGANVFQGVVNGAAVQFFGIPVLPPVTSGFSRVYRITNVRVNANNGGGVLSSGLANVTASISISGATSLPIQNYQQTVGYITKGMTTTVNSAATFNQCNATTGQSAILAFSENFATAFKTRVDGIQGGVANNYTSTGLMQNTPGGTYNSESNFVYNSGKGDGLSGGGYTAGLADYGTRLKAIFFNVPAGMTVYVSVSNVQSNGAQQIAAPSPANTTSTSYALLLSSETASDGSGTLPLASLTNSFTPTSTSSSPSAAIQYAAFTSQGAAIPVEWEVINTMPFAQETIYFSVFISYTGVTQTFPPAGTAQVAMTFAPTPTNGAFSATSAGAVSSSLPIPRFADTTGGATSTLFTINLCTTTLLFPYVTTATGFDTGLAIANTTSDPFGTTNQAGSCALNWYQGGTAGNPAASSTGNIATGTVWTGSSAATANAGPAFTGYMIAVCNFQLAHGVAIVQDIGAQRIITTVMALVVPTGIGKRTPPPTGGEQLNN
jgi:hypothetical protein